LKQLKDQEEAERKAAELALKQSKLDEQASLDEQARAMKQKA
jgi:hypothetical protein